MGRITTSDEDVRLVCVVRFGARTVGVHLTDHAVSRLTEDHALDGQGVLPASPAR